MTELLRAEAVKVVIGKAVLVDHISITQREGSITAVIGPNGAGKSTLMSVLAAERRPSSGTVEYLGFDASTLSLLERARHRSVLTQTRPFDVPFTTWEVVMMARHPHRRDPNNSPASDEEAVIAALKACDVFEFRHRVFASLSGGEQARVSIARVLAQETPLVLLDEPAGGLDIGHGMVLLRQLRNLAGHGAGVIAVFHDLNAAAAVADWLVLLDRGREMAGGSPHEVLRADLLSEVYQEPLRVIDHPFHDRPLVLPVT